MPTNSLARLKPVELREYWPGEARDFTPWLAEPDNIALLGETIGIELEVAKQEAEVGPFRADLLCRDLSDNSLVLIENQLERTDHIHLGQILTYAAGLDAVTVLWIAQRFTEEHRAAVDWLNRITHDGFDFFAIEIELWRIGSSSPAPRFNIVAKPNNWSKFWREKEDAPTPAQQLWVEYWTGFIAYLEDQKSGFPTLKAPRQHWLNFAIGRSNIWIAATISTRDGHVDVALDMAGPDAKAHFHLLRAEAATIEAALGFPVIWEERPDKISSAIRVRLDEDTTNKANWPNLYRWMLDKLNAFNRVFRPRVAELDASDWVPQNPE